MTSTRESESARESERRRESVLRIVAALNADGLGGGDVLEELFRPDARNHGSSELLGDGPTGARAPYLELRTRIPGAVATIKRTVADGEFVGVHWHASADPSDEFSGESWCDFFRFDGDRVAEHWQLHVAVPPSTVSGRSLFSDAHPRHGLPHPDPALTEVNREVASAAFARFIDFDQSVVADHWGEVYLQHNEVIPDGVEGLRDSLKEVGALPDELRPSFTVLLTLAEGDLVWFLERVRVGDRTGLGVDVFRLVEGRIVEHWDVPALRPGGGG